MEENVDRNETFYEGYKKAYDFRKGKTIPAFGNDI